MASDGDKGLFAYVNGMPLSVMELRQLEMQVGSPIYPGNYIVNWWTGCWVNLSTGAQGCQSGQATFSRHGSGSRDADGTWNHYSEAAGGAVGGSSDGCIYTTFGWSSC